MDPWVSRLPSAFAMVIIGVCVERQARLLLTLEYRLFAVLITVASVLFFFIAGSSTVDLTLAGWLALATWSWLELESATKPRWSALWCYFFFIALGLAFLTKGPLVFVLSVAPVLLVHRAQRKPLPAAPYARGLILFLLVVSPWFIASAQRNPDFLHYFFIQENLLRFISADYGDKFGTGHRYPYGTAILLALLAFLPGTPLMLMALRSFWNDYRHSVEIHLTLWLWVAWGLAPILFFALARQIHAAYVLPSLPPLALLTSYQLSRRMTPSSRFIERISSLLVLCSLLVFVSGYYLSAGTGPMIVCGLIGLGTWLLVCRIRTNTERRLVNQLTCLLVLCAALYTQVLLSAGEFLSIRRSIGYSIRSVSELVEPSSQVGFFTYNAFSAYYYSRISRSPSQSSPELLFINMFKGKLAMPRYLMVTDNDLKKLPSKYLNAYRFERVIGKWTLLRTK